MQKNAAQHNSTSASENDPNIIQARASNPEYSVWVSASAGTGKTKVLTDRLLRLMLPTKDGEEGTLPYRILCLTFTKIAAAEMKTRISEKLSKWATLPDPDLYQTLKNLVGHSPTDKQTKSARKLFADIIDAPGGLKIMTIHAFCQSILSRFPLEAGITPGFKVAEDSEAEALVKKSFENILSIKDNASLNDITHRLLKLQNEEQLLTLVRNIINEKTALSHLIAEKKSFGNLAEEIYTLFDLTIESSEEQLLDQFSQKIYQQKDNCYALIQALNEQGTRDQGYASSMKTAIESDAFNYHLWKHAFLTNQGKIRSISTKINEDITNLFQNFADDILRFDDRLKSLKTANMTVDLLTFSYAVIGQYDALKKQKGLLDYNDLIDRTAQLLQNAQAWVMYKLDGGIDHILVDEAQDTNPEQWQIIKHLSEDFFSGFTSREDILRTLFVVGDEKQSIFSFQRADPQSFETMQKFFEKKVKDAQQKWDLVPMNISFRSVQGILDHVDQSFSHMKHFSFRKGQASHVEIWPLFEDGEKEKLEPWSPPINIIEQEKSGPKLAKHIADTIKKWLDEKRIIPNHDRPIEPKDVMILVRSRNAFVQQLMRCLKTNQIPISGADRMVITNEISILDIQCAMDFALLPDNDLNLATLLKSPFIGMNEEELFDLSYQRESSLWTALKACKSYKNVADWCAQLIQHASALPFAFIHDLLYRPCPANDESGIQALQSRLGLDIEDPIGEFLTQALKFEENNIATLQNFLQFTKKQKTEIKREMDMSDNVVRIMTAHGSKGLQAPIVILPDTTRNASSYNKMSNLLWPKDSNLPVPIWAASKEYQPQLYQNSYERLKNKEDAEYDRLLYVAMTRAEDELYICGKQNKKGILDHSWYKTMLHAMENMPEHKKACFNDIDETEKLVLSRPRSKNPDRVHKQDKDNESIILKQTSPTPTPHWLKDAHPPEEDTPPRPLSPSRPSEQEDHALSPLKGASNYRFLRGNITHALLQFLPDIPQDKRAETAKTWLNKEGKDLNQNIRDEIYNETISILDNPDFSDLFSTNAQAEVPITALIGNNVISGKIDRLYVDEKKIWIIDYKSNRPSPKTLNAVPLMYKNQMNSYASVLNKIYPNREIKKFLLWTDTLNLMEI